MHVLGAVQRGDHGPPRGFRSRGRISRIRKRQGAEAPAHGGRQGRRRGQRPGGGIRTQPRDHLRAHPPGKRQATHRGDAHEQTVVAVALRVFSHGAHQGINPRRRGRHPVR